MENVEIDVEIRSFLPVIYRKLEWMGNARKSSKGLFRLNLTVSLNTAMPGI